MFIVGEEGTRAEEELGVEKDTSASSSESLRSSLSFSSLSTGGLAEEKSREA